MKVKIRDLTNEQYKYYSCINDCENCPFFAYSGCLNCITTDFDKIKDLFSDKFLDREVEVE